MGEKEREGTPYMQRPGMQQLLRKLYFFFRKEIILRQGFGLSQVSAVWKDTGPHPAGRPAEA